MWAEFWTSDWFKLPSDSLLHSNWRLNLACWTLYSWKCSPHSVCRIMIICQLMEIPREGYIHPVFCPVDNIRMRFLITKPRSSMSSLVITAISQATQPKFNLISMHWFYDSAILVSVFWQPSSSAVVASSVWLWMSTRFTTNPLCSCRRVDSLSFPSQRNLFLLITHNSSSLLSLWMMSSITHGWN